MTDSTTPPGRERTQITALLGMARAGDAHAGERGAVVAFGAIAFVAQLREYLLGIESDMIMLMAHHEQPPGDAPAGDHGNP